MLLECLQLNIHTSEIRVHCPGCWHCGSINYFIPTRLQMVHMVKNNNSII